jgi:predicted ArsR family transcriptional regulator
MDLRQLDRTLGDLASTLGDPTRRGIYITVRESTEPLTASQIAALFDIHPNVARHHLDRLADDGYLTITRRRPEGKGGPGAGRPAKCYSASDKEIALHVPGRRFDLLAELLVRVVERLAPDDAAATAESVGREYARELAAEIGLPDQAGYDLAVRAVAQALTGVGFEVAPDLDNRRLLTSHCPFGSTATDHPEVVCSLDRGLVAGLMEALDQACRPVVHPHTNPSDDCVTEVGVDLVPPR